MDIWSQEVKLIKFWIKKERNLGFLNLNQCKTSMWSTLLTIGGGATTDDWWRCCGWKVVEIEGSEGGDDGGPHSSPHLWPRPPFPTSSSFFLLFHLPFSKQPSPPSPSPLQVRNFFEFHFLFSDLVFEPSNGFSKTFLINYWGVQSYWEKSFWLSWFNSHFCEWYCYVVVMLSDKKRHNGGGMVVAKV